MENFYEMILEILEKSKSFDLTSEDALLILEWAQTQEQYSEPVAIDPILYKLRIAQMDVAVYSALLNTPENEG
jgi:hypothetical protein